MFSSGKILFRAVFLLSVFLSVPGFSEDIPQDTGKKDENNPVEKEKIQNEDPKNPKEQMPKEKSGEITVDGKKIPYLVQTGTIPVLKDDGTPRANVFYVYYAMTGGDGKRLCSAKAGSRPVMFCFNGGPGASAVWLHLGGIGPKKVDLSPDGLSPTTVADIVDNPNTVLDVADLVFVDPVSTGLSRVTKGEKPENFYGVEEDIQAAGEFVRLFTTREQRWASPKFLCGESYGVMRVAGLADYLQEKYGLYLDGLVLVSGLVNFQTILATGSNDLPYILFLPNLTATAFYHKKLPKDLQSDFGKAIKESRDFAQGEYTLALMKGSNMSAPEKKSISEKLAHLTGLDAAKIDEQDMRIDPFYFREMLLRKEGKIIGRFDGRVVSDDGDHSEQHPEFDPSFSNITGAFASAVNAYIRGELGYESDHPYHLLTGLPWRWSSFEGRYVTTENRLADAMKTNPKMRVLVITGYRDLAVPEDSMRYSLSHMKLPENARSNIIFSSYESGHMMYLFAPDAEKLRKDMLEFIKPSVK